MSVQMRDSWEVLPPREPHGTTNEVSLSGWAFEYGVIPEQVPFELRNYDPISFVQDVRQGVADAPVTKATFSTAEVREYTGLKKNGAGSNLRSLIRLAGSWELSDGSHFDEPNPPARWVNPNYIHVTALDPSIKDRRYRVEELRRSASIGLLSSADIAPRFGVEHGDGVHEFCRRWQIPWGDWRQWGKCRLARTAKLAWEWGAHSKGTLCDAFGLPRTTLHDWIHEHYAADFEVPADPSGEPWFGISARGGDDT